MTAALPASGLRDQLKFLLAWPAFYFAFAFKGLAFVATLLGINDFLSTKNPRKPRSFASLVRPQTFFQVIGNARI